MMHVKQYTVLSLLFLFLTACGGGSSGKSDNDNDGQVTDQQSAKEKFIAARGNPDMFSIIFQDDASTNERRRTETWFYGGTDAKSVIFDNEYFVEELIEENASVDFGSISVKPADFNAAMTRSEVITEFGQPDEEEFEELFGQDYRSIRYDASANDPLISIVFIDSLISAVNVGFELEYSEDDGQVIVITPVNAR